MQRVHSLERTMNPEQVGPLDVHLRALPPVPAPPLPTRPKFRRPPPPSRRTVKASPQLPPTDARDAGAARGPCAGVERAALGFENSREDFLRGLNGAQVARFSGGARAALPREEGLGRYATPAPGGGDGMRV